MPIELSAQLFCHVTKDGDSQAGRFMADTEVHGPGKFVKTLPNSHSVDNDFQAGYMGALENSLPDRLKSVDWDKNKSLDPGSHQDLLHDLSTLSGADSKKANIIWAENVPDSVEKPSFIPPIIRAWWIWSRISPAMGRGTRAELLEEVETEDLRGQAAGAL